MSTVHPIPINQLTAADIMRTDVITVAADTPLADVERVLADNRITGVPVSDPTGHIVGVLTVRDLLEHYTEDPDAKPRREGGFYDSDELLEEEELADIEVQVRDSTTAGDIMTAQVHAVEASATVPEIAQRLIALNLHRVLVQEKKRYVGLVSTTDVLRAVAGLGRAEGSGREAPAGKRKGKPPRGAKPAAAKPARTKAPRVTAPAKRPRKPARAARKTAKR
jgi:CBS domain-containing protein